MNIVVEFLRELASGLFAQSGLPWFIAALLVSLAVLGVRLFRDRRRLSYAEVYNSKVGFHPPFDPPPSEESHELTVLRNFNNVSVVVIKVWNSGWAKIDAEDYLQPLRFVADDRYIVDFRVSEVVPPGLIDEAEIDASWRVGPRDEDENRATSNGMSRIELRSSLPASLYSDQQQGSLDREALSRRRTLRIPPLALGRDHSFKVVVCLREDTDLSEHQATEKDYSFDGQLQRPGLVVPRGKLAPARSWVRRTATITAVVSLILVVGTVLRPPPPDYCAIGDLRLVGSSAFEPTVSYAATRYGSECSGASIRTSMSSSLDGVRELRGATSPTMAFSDGTATESEDLQVEPVAVLTYSVIINDAAGITNLTTAQIRGRLRRSRDELVAGRRP